MSQYVILPVFNTLILPNADLSIPVTMPKEFSDRIRETEQHVILVPLNKLNSQLSASPEDYYPLGILAEVKQTAMTVSGQVMHLHLGQKGTLSGFVKQDSWYEGNFTPSAEMSEPLDDETFRRLLVAAETVKMTPADKYDLLALDSAARTERIHSILSSYEDMLNHAEETSRRAEQKANRKDYRKRIDDAGMPEDVLDEVNQIYERYEAAPQNDPERGSMENYLDFITDLKWSPDETPEIDLKKARAVLNRDHYGLDKVKERILQQLAVMTLKKNQTGSILLLVGAPGTGKTSMGKSVAEALGRKYSRISLGGVRDEAEIRGHRRTYIGAMPGRIMDGIKKAGAMNPVMVLDEIDKLAQGYNGDPASALLEVLDPEQNSTFTDHYMNVPYDLSHVFFICTANSTETIPGPLLDRMEVIQLSGYTQAEKLEIAKKYLLPHSMKDTGISESQLSVDEDALKKVIEEYTMEAGVRGLKKQMDILCRHTAAEIVEHQAEHVSIHADEVSKYLGNQHITHDRILARDQVGVVTGLAWTPVGGEILFIETRAMPGSGQIIITGQLGDVMKESARISASLVKSEFSAEENPFKDLDIHIHVPSGSVKKDGPSAGVTLYTALTSLATGRAVSRELAMTGEISLRGQVLPIGGLPEKLMAADRAGIKKVLIPEANVQDLEDVPEETRNHLEIIPVSTIEDVRAHAFPQTAE